MSRQACHVFVSGLVQGVAFRWHTLNQAEVLGVFGWVRNLDDGRVEVRLEGEDAAFEEMLSWLRSGPPAAHVSGLDVRPRGAENLESFEIRR